MNSSSDIELKCNAFVDRFENNATTTYLEYLDHTLHFNSDR